MSLTRPPAAPPRGRRARNASVAALAVVGLLVSLTACTPTARPRAVGAPLEVVASFYPLQYVVERVGGSSVDVRSLTKPGAEPHDLELTARDVANVQDAGFVVYLKGFQPAVDAAVVTAHPSVAVDVSGAARLDLTYHPVGETPGSSGPSLADPHFWLDPTRLRDVAAIVERRMAQAAPEHAAAYAAGLASLDRDLTALDAQYRTGLQQCSDRVIVTSHNAFGYLAERYGLQQVGITGLSPEAEPGPRQLAEVATYVRSHHVRTVYYETLVSPDVARTLARATGTTATVLDPLEGLSEASAGRSYVEIMRANLQAIRKGQSCE